MNLNRELACAVHYNHAVLHDALSARDLWRMVTIDAARVVHDDALIGSIAVGKVADLALFDANGGDPYEAVVRATPATVALVLRGGTILYGKPDIVDALRPGCGTLDVASHVRRVCSEVGRPDIAALQSFATGRALYPVAFADTPLNEPPCEMRE